MLKLSTHFEEILSYAHRNFEETNKILESSTIINYCIIFINAYYNYIINAQYHYYISNKDSVEEYDKEENMELNGDAITSCLK